MAEPAVPEPPLTVVIRGRLDELQPAMRRVAEKVLADPRAASAMTWSARMSPSADGGVPTAATQPGAFTTCTPARIRTASSQARRITASRLALRAVATRIGSVAGVGRMCSGACADGCPVGSGGRLEVPVMASPAVAPLHRAAAAGGGVGG